MFKNPRSLTSFAAVAMLTAMCSVEAEVAEVGGATAEAQPAGATAEALAAATATAAAETRKRAAAANFLPIVRGRLPLVFVHAIRFDATIGAMGNKDTASKFGTSVGKVFDIKKGRNFAYITAEYKPSAEDLAAAQAWIDQVGAENAKGLSAVGDKALMVTVLEQYKSGGLASAEDIAKLTAARGAARTVKAAAPATGVLANKAPATEKITAGNTGSADDLLA
jgi:hypothetical protein